MNMFEFRFSIEFSLNFVTESPIYNKPIGSDNGMALNNRRQPIIWTSDGLVYRRIYVSRLQWINARFYEKGHNQTFYSIYFW